jgi:hypothetical protein
MKPNLDLLRAYDTGHVLLDKTAGRDPVPARLANSILKTAHVRVVPIRFVPEVDLSELEKKAEEIGASLAYLEKDAGIGQAVAGLGKAIASAPAAIGKSLFSRGGQAASSAVNKVVQPVAQGATNTIGRVKGWAQGKAQQAENAIGRATQKIQTRTDATVQRISGQPPPGQGQAYRDPFPRQSAPPPAPTTTAPATQAATQAPPQAQPAAPTAPTGEDWAAKAQKAWQGSGLADGKWQTKLPMLAGVGLAGVGAVKGTQALLNFASKEHNHPATYGAGVGPAGGVNEYGQPDRSVPMQY